MEQSHSVSIFIIHFPSKKCICQIFIHLHSLSSSVLSSDISFNKPQTQVPTAPAPKCTPCLPTHLLKVLQLYGQHSELLNIRTFSASKLNQMTRWKTCRACHGPVQYSIKFTYSKGAQNILGLILLYISCKHYRDNKLKELLTAVSDFTQQRQVTTDGHGSVSLSGLF